ncbi:hypothetical protein WR25_03080 [Diploscapter pachys]|uniref:Serpin domain-containing protein n=1 Tax=Diploscapter pachys TaxID=2018661 RepID=A0A2A2L5X9_9BILA|nr:hypothetical protein WR25_03080 [Diploscapter pachys]
MGLKDTVNNDLVRYALAVFEKHDKHCNFCISPLQALRAWALLQDVAMLRTKDVITNFLIKCGSEADLDHYDGDAMAPVPRAVRLYCDEATTVAFNSNVEVDTQLQLNANSKMVASNSIKLMSFGSDHDGLAAIHHINEDISKSTDHFVQYVVPEETAPNCRAQLLLVSACALLFVWKPDCGDLTVLDNVTFNMTASNGEVKGNTLRFYKSSGSYEYEELGNGLTIVGLQGEDDAQLYLMKQDDDKGETGAPIKASHINALLNYVLNSDHQTKDITIQIPAFAVAYPLCLSKMKRIFDREKSELYGLSRDCKEVGLRNHVTLWDHYHKALFTLLTKRPEKRSINDSVYQNKTISPDNAFTTRLPKIFGKKGRLSGNGSEPAATSYGRYVEQWIYTETAAKPENENRHASQATSKSIEFTSPFLFVMTRTVNKERLVIAMGRFSSMEPYD